MNAFSKAADFSMQSFQEYDQSVNGLDPDKAQQELGRRPVGPALGLNFLQTID